MIAKYIITLAIVLVIVVSSQVVLADSGKGNMGKCQKINKEIFGDKNHEDCKSSFTGKDHNEPPPLP